MRKIILNLAVSLDGFIEGLNGETDWCIMDDDMKFEDFISGIDTILYGRVSYDAWGTFAPGPDAGVKEQQLWKDVHSKNKIVFSSNFRPPHDKTVFISSDIAKHMKLLKQQQGKDIWLYGGAGLIRSFIELDLIDIYKISVHPIVLGKGKPLFEDLKHRIPLQLQNTRVFRSGVVELEYRPGSGLRQLNQ